VRSGIINRGQRAQIITERAVFEVTAEGLVLKEVAKGVDVRRHIIEQMEFAPVHIADKPKLMDDELFAH
jgi:propionate CoA-transferase